MSAKTKSERLRRLNPERFGPRERTEYIVGLGETLYFDQSFGSSAAVFDSVLQSPDGVTGDARVQPVHPFHWMRSASCCPTGNSLAATFSTIPLSKTL